MFQKKHIVALLIIFTASFCSAQSDSINATGSSKINLSSSLLYSDFPSFRFPLDTTFYNWERQETVKLYLAREYAYPVFPRVYYGTFYKRDFSDKFSEKFNPANPWGAGDPIQGIASGSINYLVHTIDKKFFYKK